MNNVFISRKMTKKHICSNVYYIFGEYFLNSRELFKHIRMKKQSNFIKYHQNVIIRKKIEQLMRIRLTREKKSCIIM